MKTQTPTQYKHETPQNSMSDTQEIKDPKKDFVEEEKNPAPIDLDRFGNPLETGLYHTGNPIRDVYFISPARDGRWYSQNLLNRSEVSIWPHNERMYRLLMPLELGDVPLKLADYAGLAKAVTS